MEHKQPTNRVKKSGIKTRCRMIVASGRDVIHVFPPGASFNSTEQADNITFVQGLPIDTQQSTYGQGFNFYLPEIATEDRPYLAINYDQETGKCIGYIKIFELEIYPENGS